MSDTRPVRRGFFHRLRQGLEFIREAMANLLLLGILLMVLLAWLAPGPVVTVPDRGALVVALQGALVDVATPIDPLERLFNRNDPANGETVVPDVIEAIGRAQDDDRIAALLLDLDNLGAADDASLEAIGRALDEFRAGDKPVIAGGSGFTQEQYFLAAHADDLWLHPMGSVLLAGYGAFNLYFRELIEKLSIQVHVFRVGTYKAAVEPWTLDAMSDAAREANRVLIDDRWGRYREVVARQRELAPETLDALVDDYPALLAEVDGDMARLALEQGLVDELLSADAQRARLVEQFGEGPDGDLPAIDHRSYLAALRSTDASPPANIGVISARGMIVMGDQPVDQIGADSLRSLIREAREDRAIRAIVLRVDSPGGSALASELIRAELELAQIEGKPVVVSMGGAAASGGYWISATADHIVAEASTLTGSIGVFSILPTFEKSLAGIGVRSDGIGTGDLSDALNPFGGVPDDLAKILQANVESTYQRFVHLVARGRELEPDRVDEIGQGRVWSGGRALELGLVDEIGGLQTAIAAAARLADIESPQTRRIETMPTPGEQLLQRLAESAQSVVGTLRTGGPADSALAQVLMQADAALSMLRRMAGPGDVQAICEACLLR